MAPVGGSSIGDDILQRLQPSQEQWTTIYFIIGYAVGILFLWNIPYLNYILYPFKIITVALHEFGHASAGWCTGAKIEYINVNPDEGGVTGMRGGNPYITLPAGYIGSCVWGSLMIFAGFNLLASKIGTGLLGVALLLVLVYARNMMTRGITVVFIGFLAFLWWFDNAVALRYVILFMGVMSALYSLWDIVEDLITRKVNESDASKFSQLCCGGCLGPRFWGLIWFVISIIFVAIAVIGGILAFKNDQTIQIGG
ncbi:peptidase M50B-like-domain-containing protein [Polychytrium aggregatum]|uniref:peptidase M50B-like-domain-containing protein n=1 Tax=Polychytrium aggregatum TaxID=110093 RepID=UPI0022FE1DE9|nr:peptidase M50B-like-domain-containing protein [Polychytrium aggregatum]KAI9203997.1 peptidase M50B-like-domain-containing protein [Polychytrium aggregatum]